jgi:hypothetical protein
VNSLATTALVAQWLAWIAQLLDLTKAQNCLTVYNKLGAVHFFSHLLFTIS